MTGLPGTGPELPWLRTRLSAHMFVSGAIFGAWAPILARYLDSLGYSPLQIMLACGTGSLANILSALLAGQIADRWLATEKLLAAISAVAGVLLLVAWTRREFVELYALLLSAAVFIIPTFPLGASLSFHHLKDPARQFPGVRVWGTMGWIFGALSLSAWLNLRGPGHLRDCLLLAAILALLNAVCSLWLPHTPPDRTAGARSATGKALAMLKDPAYAIFIASLFLFQASTVFFFPWAPMYLPTLGIREENMAAVMSLGQAAEIFMIFALPVVYRRLGAKGTIALGIALWGLRYGVFALGTPVWLVIASLALHGPGFAFSRIAATIYVDRLSDRDVRASAQTLLSLTIDGMGPFLGLFAASAVLGHFKAKAQGGALDWHGLWLVPTVACAVVLLAFLASFRPRPQGGKQGGTVFPGEPSLPSPVRAGGEGK